MAKELALRKEEFKNTTVETIYFGGGTPSVLSPEELQFLISQVYVNYSVSKTPEITLEANPDDLIHAEASFENVTQSALVDRSKNESGVDVSRDSIFKSYRNIGINRLSIGIQSFREEDLKLMNRAHNAKEAKTCLEEATKYFENISVDLIYGIPGLTNDAWKENINMALSFNIPHISSYALTVEPKTALEHFINKGIIDNVDDDVAQEQFYILVKTLEYQDFVHYELSNFGKAGFFSRNNSAYWQGKHYIGIGPSAHSFNGIQRSWNVRNNSKYIKEIEVNSLPLEIEILTTTDKYNEYVMTGLRTVWGVSLNKVSMDFGEQYKAYLLKQAESFINQHLLYIDDGKLMVTKKGKFLSDGIASNLFKLNL